MSFSFDSIEAIVARRNNEMEFGLAKELLSPSNKANHNRGFASWTSEAGASSILVECPGRIYDKEVELIVVKDIKEAVYQKNLDPDQLLLLLGIKRPGLRCFTMNAKKVKAMVSSFGRFEWMVGIHENRSKVFRDAADQLAHDYFYERYLNGSDPWEG